MQPSNLSRWGKALHPTSGNTRPRLGIQDGSATGTPTVEARISNFQPVASSVLFLWLYLCYWERFLGIKSQKLFAFPQLATLRIKERITCWFICNYILMAWGDLACGRTWEKGLFHCLLAQSIPHTSIDSPTSQSDTHSSSALSQRMQCLATKQRNTRRDLPLSDWSTQPYVHPINRALLNQINQSKVIWK